MGEDCAVSDAVAAGVRQAVLDDFYGRHATSGNARVGLASRTYASRFYAPAMTVPGVKNVHSVEIALGQSQTGLVFKDALDVRGDQEPVLSLDNVLIV